MFQMQILSRYSVSCIRKIAIHMKTDQIYLHEFNKTYFIVSRTNLGTGTYHLRPVKLFCSNQNGNTGCAKHLVIEVNNGKILGFSGCDDVNYAEVLSGKEECNVLD